MTIVNTAYQPITRGIPVLLPVNSAGGEGGGGGGGGGRRRRGGRGVKTRVELEVKRYMLLPTN